MLRVLALDRGALLCRRVRGRAPPRPRRARDSGRSCSPRRNGASGTSRSPTGSRRFAAARTPASASRWTRRPTPGRSRRPGSHPLRRRDLPLHHWYPARAAPASGVRSERYIRGGGGFVGIHAASDMRWRLAVVRGPRRRPLQAPCPRHLVPECSLEDRGTAATRGLPRDVAAERRVVRVPAPNPRGRVHVLAALEAPSAGLVPRATTAAARCTRRWGIHGRPSRSRA